MKMKKRELALNIFLVLVYTVSVLVFTNLLLMAMIKAYDATHAPWLSWFVETEDINRFDTVKSILMIIPAYILYRKLNKVHPQAAVNWSAKKGIALSLVAGIGFGGISFLWVVFVRNVLAKIDFIGQSLKGLEASSGMSYTAEMMFFAILAGGILAPILEELIFRGLIFRTLEKIGSGRMALFVSAFLFGIAHMSFVQGVYTFIMGLIAGVIYLKTRNLWWPIIMHITINSIAAMRDWISASPYQYMIGIWEKVALVMIVPTLYLVYQLARSTSGNVLKEPAVDTQSPVDIQPAGNEE